MIVKCSHFGTLFLVFGFLLPFRHDFILTFFNLSFTLPNRVIIPKNPILYRKNTVLPTFESVNIKFTHILTNTAKILNQLAVSHISTFFLLYQNQSTSLIKFCSSQLNVMSFHFHYRHNTPPQLQKPLQFQTHCGLIFSNFFINSIPIPNHFFCIECYTA